MKTCTRCKQIKHISNFNKNITTKDGYSIYCRTCTKIMTANRHFVHPYTTLKQNILDKTGKKCYLCGADSEIDIHHIIPRTMGGKDEAKNLIPLCKYCHIKAHNGSFSSGELNEELLHKFIVFTELNLKL